MLHCVIFVGIFLPNSFGIDLKDGGVLQSITKDIENLKTAYNICAEKLSDTDDLRHTIAELQKQNTGLTAKVQQLEQDRQTQVCDRKKNKEEGKTSSVGTSVPFISGQIQPQPGTLGIQKRQIPADGRVAFTAGLSAQIPNLGSHHTVIFDSVVTNIGNAYHPNSGVFIAPYKGAYVFNVKMKVPPRHKLHLQLVVDGKVVFDLGVEIPSSTDYESANEEFIIEVNQGADVFVRSDANGGLLYGYMRSLFSGFLLFETE
ncbi:cerebellin-1-like [Mercenaria mercenaria]|uniref:cerebellin-1-like n=1 Tax=Mercenaria mercenaria TaxID=6596 RepID=UPI00234F9384|nr:cerebellin-1-like [Mercenaria mercenaria]